MTRYPPQFIWGHTRYFKENPIGLLQGLFNESGDIARLRLGPITVHLLSHPDYVKQVLVDNHSQYTKGILYDQLKLTLGEGLVTSTGANWMKHRRLMQPAFHQKQIAGFFSMLVRAAQEAVQEWPKRQGAALDFHYEMMKLALRMVSEALFSTDVSKMVDRISHDLTICLNYVMKRVENPLGWPAWFPTPSQREFKKAKNDLDQLVLDLIAERRKSSEKPPDLLNMLLEARDEETGESMSDKELLDEVLTLLMAGHETTANGLTWAFYLLAKHPEIQQQAQAEVDTVSLSSLEDFRKLSFTKMVFEETLRLYPPVWLLGRSPTVDQTFQTTKVKAKTIVWLCPYITHRHPAFWDDPEKFDPSRFAPEKSVARHRYAYFPFGGGPRLCIGNNFAMMEATVILAIVLQSFSVSLIDSKTPDMDPKVTLRPRGSMNLKLTPR